MTAKTLTEISVLRLLRDVRRDVAAMDAQRLAASQAAPRLHEDPAARAAAALAIHHYYTAFETLVSRVLRALEGDLPQGPDWHVALLENASSPLEPIRPALISGGALPVLGELRRFRHFLRNAYAVDLDAEHLAALVETLETLAGGLREDLDGLVAFLESLSEHLAGGS